MAVYGNKISDAKWFANFQHRKPVIIPELYWKALLDESIGNT